MHWQLEIRGNPAARSRPRWTKAGHTYQPRDCWREDMVSQIRQAAPETPVKDAAVTIVVVFRFAKPKSHPKLKERQHTVRPDLDNLVGNLVDALCGLVIVSDSQVDSIHASKRYCYEDEPAGALVRLSAS